MRLIDADALQRRICGAKCGCEHEDCGCEGDCVFDHFIFHSPTIEAEPVKRGRCRYCSANDGSGLQWDFEDFEVSVTLQAGALTICNQYGDEAKMPINYCPNCGAKMDLEG